MIPIMPEHQSAVCEMPLNAVTDCVVVESLRCPYCLAAVEIRQGDGWSCYWCSQHGPIENPISFSDTTLAGRLSSPVPFHRRELAISRHLFSPFAGGGLFLESFRMHPAAMMPFLGHKSDNRAVGCITRGFDQ